MGWPHPLHPPQGLLAGWGPPVVPFLAFGNGAPDIFSAVVAFSDPRTAGLAVGAIFGESCAGRGGWGPRDPADWAALSWQAPGSL